MLVIRRCLSAHQLYKHSKKLLSVDIHDDVDGTQGHLRLILVRPGQRIPVTGSAIKIDAHVTRFSAGDDARVYPCGRRNLVPHVVGTWAGLEESSHVSCRSCAARFYLPDHPGDQACLDRDVCGSTRDLLPRCTQHNPRCFRIKPEIELMSG